MRFHVIRSTRAFAFVLGSSVLLAGPPAFADQAGTGDTGGSTIGETDRNRELDTGRERRDQMERDDSTLGTGRGTGTPEPAGATGRGTTGDEMGAGGTGTGTGTDRGTAPGMDPRTGTGTGTGAGGGMGGTP